MVQKIVKAPKLNFLIGPKKHKPVVDESGNPMNCWGVAKVPVIDKVFKYTTAVVVFRAESRYMTGHSKSGTRKAVTKVRYDMAFGLIQENNIVVATRTRMKIAERSYRYDYDTGSYTENKTAGSGDAQKALNKLWSDIIDELNSILDAIDTEINAVKLEHQLMSANFTFEDQIACNQEIADYKKRVDEKNELRKQGYEKKLANPPKEPVVVGKQKVQKSQFVRSGTNPLDDSPAYYRDYWDEYESVYEMRPVKVERPVYDSYDPVVIQKIIDKYAPVKSWEKAKTDEKLKKMQTKRDFVKCVIQGLI